jgi:two-component system sensor histidine kinase KdpD
VAGVESKPRQDITPTPDADPLLGSVASGVARYLASFAMTAVATVRGCRYRQHGDDP